MRQRWERLSFLHWPVEPDAVQPMLPPGLEVDVHDGAAWVGLVPFQMRGIGLPRGPAVPYLGTFAETNIRTYVVGSAGPGVWFNSLDIDRGLPVPVARLFYGLPYQWSAMSIRQFGDEITYAMLRRRPHRLRPHSAVTVRIGEPVPFAAQTPLDHFLTARWRLYTSIRGSLLTAPVAHEPWPLHRADAVAVADGLVAAGGYPRPATSPVVRYSPGVAVTAGRPVPA
jgi:uncharacterized protein YqjF (DUF2071 family)